MDQKQFEKVREGQGFIAALDQSGGSTPKALKLYGVGEDAYTNEEEMFDRIHEMRSRVIESPSFDGSQILGAILFEMTMDRQVAGRPTGEYLWAEKQVVPLLQVDQCLAAAADGVPLLKPKADHDQRLQRGLAQRTIGTTLSPDIKLSQRQDQ